MTVRVEKLQSPVPLPFVLAMLGALSSATGFLFRWWQRPTTLVMSQDWLNERARSEGKQGL